MHMPRAQQWELGVPCYYLKAASEVGHPLVPGLWGRWAANCWHQVGLVRLAQASHPELEKLDVVLLRSSQNAQQFLRIFLGSAVHFSELKEDLHFTAETRNSCHYDSGLTCIKQGTSSNCSFSWYLLQLNVNKSFKQYPMETILMLWMKKAVGRRGQEKGGLVRGIIPFSSNMHNSSLFFHPSGK